jgi:hypothetical protein
LIFTSGKRVFADRFNFLPFQPCLSCDNLAETKKQLSAFIIRNQIGTDF